MAFTMRLGTASRIEMGNTTTKPTQVPGGGALTVNSSQPAQIAGVHNSDKAHEVDIRYLCG